MSTTEAEPDFTTCESGPDGSQILEPREVPLGGLRAMNVRRTLPQRARSLIGAWCFVDHYGPDRVDATGGMLVNGHPHTGLQTVSWLFDGEIEHRDTVGSVRTVRPGEVNLMTAGRGIAHSEISTPESTVLRGVQLWIALPESERHTAPRFEHHVPEPSWIDGARLSVFVGSLMGATSPVWTATRLLGAELRIEPTATVTIEVDPTFEHGLLVDDGRITVAGADVGQAELLFVPAGPRTLTVTAGPEPARILLIGGEPLGERIIMWWNFIGRTHEEIVEYRQRWQDQAFGADRDGTGDLPYGPFPEQWRELIPAPPLPNGRLKLRA
ncbi:pirin family protein [Micromonospora sp. NPDC050397]|uniref:pirin family protein n=1 Tax=Micromonospora sp. NPDC050397 TaxID=3364279 RepID=UPI00384CB49A